MERRRGGDGGEGRRRCWAIYFACEGIWFRVLAACSPVHKSECPSGVPSEGKDRGAPNA